MIDDSTLTKISKKSDDIKSDAKELQQLASYFDGVVKSIDKWATGTSVGKNLKKRLQLISEGFLEYSKGIEKNLCEKAIDKFVEGQKGLNSKDYNFNKDF